MEVYGIEYRAVLYYTLRDGTKIIFNQSTNANIGKVVFRNTEPGPQIHCHVAAARDDTAVLEYKNVGFSLFHDYAVASAVGHMAKELGQPFHALRDCFQETRIFFPGLDAVVSANIWGTVFRDVSTNFTLASMPVEVFDRYEKGSLFLMLRKMLSSVEKAYGVSYDIRNFL